MGKHVFLPVNCIRLFWVALSFTTVATLLGVACGGTPTTPIQPGPTTQAKPSSTPSLTPIAIVNVKILEKNGKYVFEPATLKIKVGTRVVWTNGSDTIHTVTSDTLIFNTNNLATNQAFTVIFSRPATYPYYRTIHTSMLGTIIVTP
jgi:plastocyanin